MPQVAPAAVDAHEHVWDPARADYPWMTPALDRLRRPFGHADVVAEQAEVGVGTTVLVQAADNLEDTANMLRVARAHSQVAGVVAWVPLDDPAAAARLLDGWQRAAEPVVGVRHLVHREADPNWLLRPEVQDGLAGLAERGLTFDVCAETAPLLRHVPALAERHPALSLVVDHLGKPPIRARGWQPWADLLAAAAEPPNVTAKVSGLNTAADPSRWSSADFQPYVDHALEVFGPHRLMYGGDWPFALLAAGSYTQIWAGIRECLDTLGPEALWAVLGGTARRVYGLPARDRRVRERPQEAGREHSTERQQTT
jgi:L-fuconolactonase